MSALQEERSAETRRRLLDATVACLFERGYAGTTTTEIATRAGVSRGAQLHHFPKKDELVVGALEHVFELRLADLSAAIAEPPSGSREDWDDPEFDAGYATCAPYGTGAGGASLSASSRAGRDACTTKASRALRRQLPDSPRASSGCCRAAKRRP